MEVIFKNFKLTLKGLNLFGLIITTANQIKNAKMEADEMKVNKLLGELA